MGWTRSGVCASPCRPGSSPISLRIWRTARSTRPPPPGPPASGASSSSTRPASGEPAGPPDSLSISVTIARTWSGRVVVTGGGPRCASARWYSRRSGPRAAEQVAVCLRAGGGQVTLGATGGADRRGRERRDGEPRPVVAGRDELPERIGDAAAAEEVGTGAPIDRVGE